MTYDPRRERLFDQCKTLGELEASKPHVHTGWLNIYRDRSRYGVGDLHATRAVADENGRLRIACIRIQFTEGEGL